MRKGTHTCPSGSLLAAHPPLSLDARGSDGLVRDRSVVQGAPCGCLPAIELRAHLDSARNVAPPSSLGRMSQVIESFANGLLPVGHLSQVDTSGAKHRNTFNIRHLLGLRRSGHCRRRFAPRVWHRARTCARCDGSVLISGDLSDFYHGNGMAMVSSRHHSLPGRGGVRQQ